jgi:hypothetical protein
MKKTRRARLIANYLPQYHPIPENDLWWGKGFTEWTNVTKAKPLFRGHHQPNLPADLGFYDLRVPETRASQAELAKEHGIEGFCYWHYWLGSGRRLLEMPFEEVLTSGEPNFPFCLGWANHSWTGVWFGAPDKTLVEQTYPGFEDHEEHFSYLLRAFSDDRYINVDGKPLFSIFRPREIPNVKEVVEFWRKLAQKAGLKGLHLVAEGLNPKQAIELGFDACSYSHHRLVAQLLPKNKLLKNVVNNYREVFKQPAVYTYHEAMPYFLKEGKAALNEYPSIVPNWDSTPRCQERGVVLHNSTPELFRQHLREAFEKVADKPFENRIIFAKSWNEWAEGNYLEPDQRFGKAYLEVIREETFLTT